MANLKSSPLSKLIPYRMPDLDLKVGGVGIGRPSKLNSCDSQLFTEYLYHVLLNSIWKIGSISKWTHSQQTKKNCNSRPPERLSEIRFRPPKIKSRYQSKMVLSRVGEIKRQHKTPFWKTESLRNSVSKESPCGDASISRYDRVEFRSDRWFSFRNR